jgi:hypothetical protein
MVVQLAERVFTGTDGYNRNAKKFQSKRFLQDHETELTLFENSLKIRHID